MDVSVVVCTRNREALLREALASLLVQQAPGVTWEVIVADNGSTEGTKALVRSIAAGAAVPVRYLEESRAGSSHARNAGVAAAAGRIVAFMDDDQDAAPGWVARVADAFERHPGIDFIGGRVLPRWRGTPPPWLTPRLRGPIGVIDRGDAPMEVSRLQWMCMPGGNMACRRSVFETVRPFAPEYPRSQDRELTVRLLRAGKRGLYVPDMVMFHKIEAARLTKRHFRRWHRAEGRMRALYRFEEIFSRAGEMRDPPAEARTLLAVPLFLYRALLAAVSAWCRATVRLRRTDAFQHETRVIYLFNYIRARQRHSGASLASAFVNVPRVLAHVIAHQAALVTALVPSHHASRRRP